MYFEAIDGIIIMCSSKHEINLFLLSDTEMLETQNYVNINYTKTKTKNNQVCQTVVKKNSSFPFPLLIFFRKECLSFAWSGNTYT